VKTEKEVGVFVFLPLYPNHRITVGEDIILQLVGFGIIVFVPLYSLTEIFCST
jgi:hypothetical protein